MLGKTLRIFFWMIKGVLLAIALAALVMWPVSRGREMWVGAWRYTAGPADAEYHQYTAACRPGRVVVGSAWHHVSGGGNLVVFRGEVQTRGDGWRWQRFSRPATGNDAGWSGRWGPLRWFIRDTSDASAGRFVQRTYAAPLYLVALVAGAWPLAAIAFALRRRIKRRHAARDGLCKSCGYDLRATPAPGGALLAKCPECGQENLASNRTSPPPS